MADKVEVELVPTVAERAYKAIADRLGAALEEAGSSGISGKTFGALVGGSEGISGIIGATGELGVALGAAGIAIGAFTKVLDQIINLAGAANPVLLQMFNDVLSDINAVIGQALVPILQLVTEAVRFFADVLATLIPSAADIRHVMEPMFVIFEAWKEVIKELTFAIKPIIDLFMELWKMLSEIAVTFLKGTLIPILEVLKPIIYVVGVVLRFLSDILIKFLKVVLSVVNGIIAVLTAPMRLLGRLMKSLGLTTDQELKSSFGASGRQAKVEGVEQYLASAATAAASGGALSLQEKQAKSLEDISGKVDKVINEMVTGKETDVKKSADETNRARRS